MTENGAAPVLPIAVPESSVLDREALLIAAMRAASATAAGSDDTEAQASLDGARYELAIRFGCVAPAPQAQGTPDATPGADAAEETAESAAPELQPSPRPKAAVQELGWTYDEKEERLRVHATPDISRETPVVGAVAGETIEAAEGFWIPRPWLLSAACPSGAATPPAAPSPRAPRLGIVQFFKPTDSRIERREQRPYESVQKLAVGDVADLRTGFELVLTGRLRALNGKVISCVAQGPDAPPTCLISAEFGNVRLVRPDTKAVLAQWGQG